MWNLSSKLSLKTPRSWKIFDHSSLDCKEDTSPILNYLKKFKCISNELAVIQQPVSDNDKVSRLANGLCPKYMNFVDSRFFKPPFPTFSQFIVLNNYELGISFCEEEKVIAHNLAFLDLLYYEHPKRFSIRESITKIISLVFLFINWALENLLNAIICEESYFS